MPELKVMNRRVGLAAAFAVGVWAVPAQAVSIVNGGFELPGTFSGGFTTVGAGGEISGWTVGGSGVDLINNYWEPSEGAYSVDLSAGSAGSVYQDLTDLSVGETYSIGFDIAGNPAGGPTVKTMRVSAGADSMDYLFDVTGKTTSSMGWLSRIFNFTATSEIERLTFGSLDATAFGPALDNVSIAGGVGPGPSPVPIPATAPLILGALGLGGLLSRRRRGT